MWRNAHGIEPARQALRDDPIKMVLGKAAGSRAVGRFRGMAGVNADYERLGRCADRELDE